MGLAPVRERALEVRREDEVVEVPGPAVARAHGDAVRSPGD